MAARIIDFIKDILAALDNALKGLVAEGREAAYVREMTDAVDELHRLWDDALFDAVDAYQIAETKKAAQGDVKMQARNEKFADYDKPITVSDIEILRSIGRKSINDFTSEDIQKSQKWAHKFYKELGVKSPFFRAWFGDWRACDNGDAIFSSDAPVLDFKDKDQAIKYIKNGIKTETLFRGNVINSDTEFVVNIGRQVYEDTLTYANRELSRAKKIDEYSARLSILSDIENIVKYSVLLDTEATGKKENDNIGNQKHINPYQSFFHRFYCISKLGGDYYLVKLTVDELNSEATSRRAYNLNDIKISPIAVSQVYKPAGTTDDSGDDLSAISISNLFALVKEYDEDFKPKPVHESMIENGKPKILYHQTENDFTEFDTGRDGAGTSDNETPFGIFLKESDRDIGLKGKKQMQLYARMFNPLVVNDRADLVRRVSELSPEYGKYHEKSKEIDREYSKRAKDAEDAFYDFIKRNAESPNRKSRQELYADEEFIKLFDAEDNIVEEWVEKNRENDRKAKEAMTKALRDKGFDGVILKIDEGSRGRSTEAYIVLDAEQVKSATYLEDLSGPTDNIGTFDRGQKDIRYQQRNQTPTDDELGVNKKLKAQNKKLRGDVQELRELLRLQKEVTHGKKFKKSSIQAAASVLMKRFELTRGKEAMAQQLE